MLNEDKIEWFKQSRTDIECLEDFIADNIELDQLESNLSGFNIFEAIGAVRRELRHSDFLKYVLDPKENHGLGQYVLKEFLKYIVRNHKGDSGISIIDIDTFDFENTELKREWRNIDILIVSEENKFIVCIENKIDSIEHSNQLSKYEEIIEDEFHDYKKLYIFMTPDGDNAKKNDKWVSVSYGNIHAVMTKVLQSKSSILGNDVLVLIKHYIEMVDRHIMSDNQIADLCRKIYSNHKRAIDLIFEHKPDFFADLQELLMTVVSRNEELNITMDHCSKSYVRFTSKDWSELRDFTAGTGEWTNTKRILLFEFTIDKNGINLKLMIGPGDTNVRKQIFDIAKNNKGIFKGGSKSLYDKWTFIYKKQFLTKDNIASGDYDGCSQVIHYKWHDFVYKDFHKIVTTICEQYI